MPKTPLIADEKDINDSYWYYGNSKNENQPTLEFQKADYLENYVNRAQKVLKFLNKQKWVDRSKINCCRFFSRYKSCYQSGSYE